MRRQKQGTQAVGHLGYSGLFERGTSWARAAGSLSVVLLEAGPYLWQYVYSSECLLNGCLNSQKLNVRNLLSGTPSHLLHSLIRSHKRDWGTEFLMNRKVS